MITLIPVFDVLDPNVVSVLKSIFPETRIFVTTGGNLNDISLVDAERVVGHENNMGYPLERIMHYYNSVLKNFIPILSDIPDDEDILLIHSNIVINESSLLLFGEELLANVFISAKNRIYSNISEASDRCISFKKESFVKYHSYDGTEAQFKNKTTIDFIIDRIKEDGKTYKIDDNVTVKELNSFWT